MSCDSDRITLEWIGEAIDFVIKQGAQFGPFEFELNVEDEETGAIEPFILTGGEIRCQIRKKGLDTGTPVAIAVTPITAENKFTLTIDADDTADIPAGELVTDRASMYVHDIFFVPAAGDSIVLYYGNAFIARQVTKPTA